MVEHKTRPKHRNEEKETSVSELVLHNDDFNTFDFVIKTLMDVCKHEPEQAEQCTLIVHHKGRCTVKTAPHDVLEPMCKQLLESGLTATIEKL
ncbi:MAG TPA: ATP-dependent Clp protease adaptor ClpS [Bacteroidales bacterium]|nr:ATP-dependent Clp protease adaptor ClpS [Bacteroidales bacterium]HPS17362.1 ATP-dependent Clp protease adaptor ClpS [Bacteroidales bacterium]